MELDTKKEDDGFDKILDVLIKHIEENQGRIQPRKQPDSNRDKLLGKLRVSGSRPGVKTNGCGRKT